MDVSFTNVLEGARQYFQGLPTATAAAGPYFQQNLQQEQTPSQQQHVIQQQHGQHQQAFFQQSNDHYAGSSTAAAGNSNRWLQQHSPSEAGRTPMRERTSVQRSSSHISSGLRPPSHASQYQDVSRQYQGPYQQQTQEHQPNYQPTSHSAQATFQFPRPQSRDLPQNHQYQPHNVTNSTYHQPASPISRPSSREQLASTMQTYQQPQSSGLPPPSPSQNQYTYQSRSYYATTQSQPLTTKPASSYTVSQSSQVGSQSPQMYYRQGTTSQIASIPVKQSNYHLENRGAEANTQSNGQYLTSTNNDQTYRATHNLPPIAALSSYRSNKSLGKTMIPRTKVPSSNSYPTSVGQSMAHSSAIQHTKTKPDPYSHTSNASYSLSNSAPNQNNQRLSQPVSSVITQSYTNVIMATPNASQHYITPTNQNYSPSLPYQRTKLEVQNVPKSQPNQNINYLKPKTVENSVLNVQNTSVIKQRKESPLDLSVKTVRTSADSTEGEAVRSKYGQNKSQNVLSSHNYPILDINNSIERSLTQRSHLPIATAPKVEFHPNFNLSSRHSSWTPKTNEGPATTRIFQETPIQGSTDYNKHSNRAYPVENVKGRYPPIPVPNIPQYMQTGTQRPIEYNGNAQNLSQMYPYDGRELTAKRPGQVESPAIPTKMAKVESWRESINLQIEEKFTSHYKQQQVQSQHPQPQMHQLRVQSAAQQHTMIDETTTSVLVNGNNSQANFNNAYNYQKPPYASIAQQNQQAYSKASNSYPQAKHGQSYVPSPSSHHYSGYYNTPNKQSQHLYINPAARHNSNSSMVTIAKTNNIATGADKRVLSLLRNSIESKEQKKMEQQKSQDVVINQRPDVQHPNTDVTAPLQPKPGIDRNNISPFTPISVPDPNICKMPPKIIASMEDILMTEEVAIVNKAANEEGLAAFLAARIRTKAELKEVAHSQNVNAARDARIQAFLEDTIKSPHRQHIHLSISSTVSSINASPPKLLKERQGAFAPRKRLFSRNDEESGKHDVPRRDKSSMRSSSETSVFDFPDSEEENEMPVLERQTLNAMRKDRRNSTKQSTTPLHNNETEVKIEILDPSSRPPSPEDDIFGSICDKFMEQLKNKSTKRIKRTVETEVAIKLEPTEEIICANTDIKVKVEIEDDGFLIAETKQKASELINCSKELADIFNTTMEDCKTPVTGNVIKSDSNMSDSEIKTDERLAARHKQRVRRKLMSSSDSSDNENDETSVKIEKQDGSEIEQKLVATEIKIEDTDKNAESIETEKLNVKNKTEETENDKLDATKSEKESPRKPSELLSVIRPAKKPSFGDGSDFYPGWEEGVYKYKKSLRMPPSLIQLTRPPMRLSTSLPDLDPCPQSPTTSITTDVETKELIADTKKSLKKFKSEPIDSDNESTSSFNVFCKKTNYDSEGSSSIKSLPNTKKENMSILDKLLEKCGGRKKRKHKRKDDHSPKVVQKSENLVELLATPTPGFAVSSKSPEKSKGLNSPVISTTSAVLPFRKDTVNHFKDAFINSGNNILAVHDKFTTIVLSSRTRKETRAMKQRATIKEVFGEDRPASAPPVSCYANDIESKKAVQKLEPFSKNLKELLIKKEKVDEQPETKNTTETMPDMTEKINHEIGSKNTLPKDLMTANIKKEVIDEDDDENKKLIDLIVKKDPDACSETMSLDGEEPGLGAKRKNKYGKMRRKFSSGFDYIRKKKKIKKEEPDNGSVERKKKKSPPGKTLESIDDIQKEIKSWVLNKGIGESHLHRAARLGFVDITAYSLERMDCPPSPKDNAGYTPLHEACARGHLEIAKLLLKFGANVHESAKGGIRPLHEAIENGFVEIVRLLLSYGADPFLATYAGLTPLSLANDENTKKLLKAHLNDRAGEGGLPWPFNGPSHCFDPRESGYDVLSETPQEVLDLDIDDIEIDMSEALLPNLYTLQGEPSTDRWVLLQDLSHFMKIKSRDALLKQISPPTTTSIKVNHKNVLRELKMTDFLEQAHCCQFLNMGEKINTRASKIALVRYTDKVKELLGIETAVVAAR